MDYYKLKVLNNKRKIIIGLFSLILILLLIYIINYRGNDVIVVDNNVDDSSNIVSQSDNKIFVDIKGQVVNPGVYSFAESDDKRINDLINEAGGLTKDADTSFINLSKKLEDEMTIIIYSHQEINEYVTIKDELEQKLNICEIRLKNSACIEKKIDENKKQININEASIDELKSLSGIGDSKAKAIIEYRKNNRFQDINDLKNVDGIGDSLFESIKNDITV